MFKLFHFLKGKPGLGREQFRSSWENDYRSAVLGTAEFVSALRRYVQNYAIAEPGIPVFKLSEFEVCDEFWFQSLEDLTSAFNHPSYRASIEPAAERLADRASAIAVVADESPQFDRGFGKVKFIGLSKRAPTFSHDEWVRYWIEVHGPTAHGIPEFTRYYGRYVQNYALAVELAPFGSPPDFDGIVEEWLETAGDMAKCLAEPRYLETVRPDEVKFVDFARSHMMLTTEHLVFER